ncbi:hypothetical protein NLG97_g4561 [Lecanicillium saksenae]|uniref:Uncharacterized protein n=1 Tax=Lecanicillium saksenae TaxID=468837 RepID=A0ACC1QWL9_9HYPO|nr:hypothetical protein NLG97_g4561 [Lecanicillium saksenae]
MASYSSSASDENFVGAANAHYTAHELLLAAGATLAQSHHGAMAHQPTRRSDTESYHFAIEYSDTDAVAYVQPWDYTASSSVPETLGPGAIRGSERWQSTYPNHDTILDSCEPINNEITISELGFEWHSTPFVQQCDASTLSPPDHYQEPGSGRVRFTSAEDNLILSLRKSGQSWKKIAQQLPGRSPGALQVRYSTKLRSRRDASNQVMPILTSVNHWFNVLITFITLM